MAPSNAASTIFVLIRSDATMSLPTVFATAVVTNAPARLATEAIRTARRGVKALVETDVATAFAVSWKPFVKSKPRATTTTTTSRASFNVAVLVGARSAVLDENRLEHVGGVFACVDSFLELLVNVLPADHRDRILA